MTDEERQGLTNTLRAARPGYPPGELCVRAAEEIDRLAEELEVHVDCDNQRALKAEMQCLALADEIEHLNRRLEALERM